MIFRVPDVVDAPQRENAFLCAALFFVASRPAECRVKTIAIERLLECFGLHHRRVQRRPREDRVDAACLSLFVGVDEEIEFEPARGRIAKRNHLAELPPGIDVKKRKGSLPGKKALRAKCTITLESLPIE